MGQQQGKECSPNQASGGKLERYERQQLQASHFSRAHVAVPEQKLQAWRRWQADQLKAPIDPSSISRDFPVLLLQSAMLGIRTALSLMSGATCGFQL